MKVDKNKSSLLNDGFDKKEKIGELDFLKSNIQSLLEDMEDIPTPPHDLLPGINIYTQQHDYDKDLDIIKEESKETLECLSGLYLDEKTMKEKNISNIIRSDSEIISNINFSINCSKRGLISCMKALDIGALDSEMHLAVGSYQKEIRDSSKMLYDTISKMKNFYKELRIELKQDDINLSGSSEKHPELHQKQTNGLVLLDPKLIDKMITEQRNNPTML